MIINMQKAFLKRWRKKNYHDEWGTLLTSPSSICSNEGTGYRIAHVNVVSGANLFCPPKKNDVQHKAVCATFAPLSLLFQHHLVVPFNIMTSAQPSTETSSVMYFALSTVTNLLVIRLFWMVMSVSTPLPNKLRKNHWREVSNLMWWLLVKKKKRRKRKYVWVDTN